MDLPNRVGILPAVIACTLIAASASAKDLPGILDSVWSKTVTVEARPVTPKDGFDMAESRPTSVAPAQQTASVGMRECRPAVRGFPH